MKEIISFLFFWRFVLFIPLLVGIYFVSSNDFGQQYMLENKIEFESKIESVFLLPWGNFDGIHYLYIAGYGYTNESRFFPLFPLLIKGVSELLGDGVAFDRAQILTGMVLVTSLFFLSLLIFKNLIELD